MEPSHYTSQRTTELSDPAMAPIKAWIESYVVWTELPKHTRASILKRASKGEPEAIEALCNHNLRLVLSCAVKQTGRGVPLPDLIQEGWLGLHEAALKYEPKRGNTFSTMALWWIKQKMQRAIVEQGRTVYLPHKASEVLLRVARKVKNGEAIDAEDQQWMDSLARKIYGNPDLHDVTIDYFDHLLSGPSSMDKPLVQQSHGGAEAVKTLADILPAPTTSHDPSDTLDLEALLVDLVNRKVLTPREGWLVVRHFGLDGEGGRTYDELAMELRDAEVRAGIVPVGKKPVSRERIRQMLSKVMTTIRLHVGQSTWQSGIEGVQYKEQRKGSQVPLSPPKVKSTESPKARSVRRTSVNDLSQETAASRPAAPTPLRANSSTQGAKGSSRRIRKSGLDVPYAEAI